MPIFDQGYQHWTGTVSGHAWRWLTITRHGVRLGMKNIFLRLLILASWVPAAVLVVMLCLWGLLENNSSIIAPLKPVLAFFFPPEMVLHPKDHRVVVWTVCFDSFLAFELYISMIVVLLVGPSLISLDLRFNALPLYLSRPLRRIDYFAGKLGVIAWFLSLVIVVPSLIAWVLGLLFSLDVTIVWDTMPLLLGCLEYGAVIVLSAGTLMLALSSLSRNSRYIALFWVALWFVSGIVGGVLNGINTAQIQMEAHHKHYKPYPMRQVQKEPLTPEQQMAEQRAFQEKERAWRDDYQNVQKEIVAEQLRASETNWRWLFSYTGNLSRIGQRLLNTDMAWHEFSEMEPPEERDQFLVRVLGPQYPWYWSAGVLTVLFGLSVCILNYRVRSLDRLK